MNATGTGVFVTGGTGYIGRALIPQLVSGGRSVKALVRQESASRLPPGCAAIIGDALKSETFMNSIVPATTFVQLVGVAHPSPAKAKEFREIDFVSVRESVTAAIASGIKHFIYLSVAQPAPVMREYIAVR